MFKILGTNDAVNSCDCCGKSNLKSTVIVDVDGEILHYGSTCATRHTGLNAKEIKQAIHDEVDVRKMAASKDYKNSMEYIGMQVKHNQAHKQGIRPGKTFSEFCKIEQEAAYTKAREIAAKYGLDVWMVQ